MAHPKSDLDTKTIEELCDIARDSSRAGELSDYLGADQYHQLVTALQGQSSRSLSRRVSGTVILLHGVMGSQIGKALRREWDIVWMNPLAIADNNFSLLKIGAGRNKYGARGLLPLFYALLWARLKFWYGYNVVEFAYDWRVGVAESGNNLVEFVNEETQGPVFLVAHSMGGLVARAAAPRLDSRVQRIIQLATPNYGSFSPVVTLRGQNEFVNKILKFDTSSSVTDLISNTVSTFQGLCELMPAPSRYSSVNLFDASLWPAKPTVNPTVLAQAKSGIEQLPGPDKRFVLIAGNNQDTVTDMSIDPTGEFRFTTTTAGDGTVPLQFARFDEAVQVPTYLANVTHNGIIADGMVSAAVDDIIRTGQTDRFPRDSRDRSRSVTGKPLDVSRALNPFQGRDVNSIPLAEVQACRREVLGPLQPANPDSSFDGGIGGIGTTTSACGGDAIYNGFKNVFVGRRRRRLRIVLAQGDITCLPAHCHVLAVFEGVTPSGPARAFDLLLNGAVSDLFQRKMFSGARGRVYFMPTYKTQVPGELLAFAGLGSFSDFQSNVVEGVAQQLIQSLQRVRVNELATVIFGGSFDDVQKYLCSMLKGFIAGLEEIDPGFDFNRIILCEQDPEKFEKLQRELYRLASSPLFDGTDVEFDVIRVADQQRTRGTPPLPTPSESDVFIFSHLSLDATADSQASTYRHEISVLPPDSGTSYSQFVIQFPRAELDKYLQSVQMGAPDNLDDFGTRLAKLVLPPELATRYKDVIEQHGVQLLHNDLSSRIPWESLKFDDICPAATRGLSRKYQRNQTAAMFSRSQQKNQKLRILLVYNPLGDLDGADKEGKRILGLTSNWSGKLEVTPLHADEATRASILDQLSKSDYDVLHYAGHAGFVADSPSQSGLVCAGREILSGRDLEPLAARLPPVVIFNACQSGRVRLVPTVEARNAPASAAEAILNAGVMSFIATFWPVSDKGADIFASTFYDQVLSSLQQGGEVHSIGSAVLAARQALKAAGENDWANYMLYGDPGFVIKKG